MTRRVRARETEVERWKRIVLENMPPMGDSAARVGALIQAVRHEESQLARAYVEQIRHDERLRAVEEAKALDSGSAG